MFYYFIYLIFIILFFVLNYFKMFFIFHLSSFLLGRVFKKTCSELVAFLKHKAAYLPKILKTYLYQIFTYFIELFSSGLARTYLKRRKFHPRKMLRSQNVAKTFARLTPYFLGSQFYFSALRDF